KGYLITQELRHRGSLVQIVGNKPSTRHGESLVVTATVLPLTPGRPIPTGSITFLIDGVAMNQGAKLDQRGRAGYTIIGLRPGKHEIRATYSGGGDHDYHPSSSLNLLHTVAESPQPAHMPGSHGGHM